MLIALMGPGIASRDVIHGFQGDSMPGLKRSLSVLLGLLVFPSLILAEPLAVKTRMLDTLHQEEAETEEQFLIRTAMRVRLHTGESGSEVCGSFCENPANGRRAIMLFTVDSRLSCPVLKGCPLGGYAVTETSIHSHPSWQLVLSAEEAARFNASSPRMKKKAGDGMRFSPRRFSKDDYRHGPGYLVYADELWHQSGKGTQRMLWQLPADAPIAAVQEQ